MALTVTDLSPRSAQPTAPIPAPEGTYGERQKLPEDRSIGPSVSRRSAMPSKVPCEWVAGAIAVNSTPALPSTRNGYWPRKDELPMFASRWAGNHLGLKQPRSSARNKA